MIAYFFFGCFSNFFSLSKNDFLHFPLESSQQLTLGKVVKTHPNPTLTQLNTTQLDSIHPSPPAHKLFSQF